MGGGGGGVIEDLGPQGGASLTDNLPAFKCFNQP